MSKPLFCWSEVSGLTNDEVALSAKRRDQPVLLRFPPNPAISTEGSLESRIDPQKDSSFTVRLWCYRDGYREMSITKGGASITPGDVFNPNNYAWKPEYDKYLLWIKIAEGFWIATKKFYEEILDLQRVVRGWLVRHRLKGKKKERRRARGGKTYRKRSGGKVRDNPISKK